MEIHVEFWFRSIEYSCSAFIDSSQYPCYIFTILDDPGLISEFGSDITIATDGKKRLAKKDDYAALVDLRQAIFNAIKEVPQFLSSTVKMKILSRDNFYVALA